MASISQFNSEVKFKGNASRKSEAVQRQNLDFSWSYFQALKTQLLWLPLWPGSNFWAVIFTGWLMREKESVFRIRKQKSESVEEIILLNLSVLHASKGHVVTLGHFIYLCLVMPVCFISSLSPYIIVSSLPCVCISPTCVFLLHVFCMFSFIKCNKIFSVSEFYYTIIIIFKLDWSYMHKHTDVILYRVYIYLLYMYI